MYYVYIAFYENNTIQGVGVTNNLKHRFRLLNTKSTNNCKLVFFEEYMDSKKATERENELGVLPKEILKEFVEDNNPMYVDLKNNH